MRRDELGSLAMFLAVAEERSFTRAACAQPVGAPPGSSADREGQVHMRRRTAT